MQEASPSAGRPDAIISRLAVAHPAYRITQPEAIAALARHTGERKRLEALARGSAIRERAIVLPAESLSQLGGAGERSARYWSEAPNLAMQAASQVVRDPSLIGCIATSSCTGYHLPGLAVELQRRLGLAPDVLREPFTDPGCAGGVVALAHAARAVRQHECGAAVAAAVELCSLSLQFEASRGNLTAALIFGDGAGAALVEAGVGRGLRVADEYSTVVPGSQHLLGFELTDHGFAPVLERELAQALPGHFEQAASTLLSRNGLGLRDVGAWLIHPGGARILREIERWLELPEGATRWSWQSLAEFGNTSSAAIFDVVRRYLDDEPRAGEWAVLAGFGPGVAIELMLVRAC